MLTVAHHKAAIQQHLFECMGHLEWLAADYDIVTDLRKLMDDVERIGER